MVCGLGLPPNRNPGYAYAQNWTVENLPPNEDREAPALETAWQLASQ